jgi:anti-sigma regulatory factor (Ser/Thr protein kinase)
MARRLASRVAHELGFNEVGTGKVALLATEAATNLVKHATQGQLLVQPLPGGGGMDLLALDRGPGMRNLHACLRDGYSTAGSSGTGLGAITRLANCWDVYSLHGVGTVLLIRLLATPAVPAEDAGVLDAGGVCVPKPREDVCGDAWTMVQHAGHTLVMVVDGLGHGLHAAEAARAAVQTVHEHPLQPPAALLERLHSTLRRTRGAAVAIAEVNAGRQEVTFAGIGNVAAALLGTEKTQSLPSQNGIVGHQMPKLRSLTYPWSDQALLLLHSDGLATRWNLTSYPGLSRRHPGVIAGVLYRDFVRGQDDVTVVAARAGWEKRPQPSPLI